MGVLITIMTKKCWYYNWSVTIENRIIINLKRINEKGNQ